MRAGPDLHDMIEVVPQCFAAVLIRLYRVHDTRLPCAVRTSECDNTLSRKLRSEPQLTIGLSPMIGFVSNLSEIGPSHVGAFFAPG